MKKRKKRFKDHERSHLDSNKTEYGFLKKSALFFEKIYNDYLKTIPKNVYVQKVYI